MKEIISTAFDLTKKNALILIGAILCLMVITLLINFLTSTLSLLPYMMFISNLISIASQIYFGIMLLKLFLLIIDGKEPEFSEIIPKFNETIRYTSVTFLTALISIVTFIICIFLSTAVGILDPRILSMLGEIAVLNQNQSSNIQLNYTATEIFTGLGMLFIISIPAIILYLRLSFANYIIIDNQHESPTTALMRSVNITKGYVLYIILAFIIIILINLVGILLFLVGLFFTIPMSALVLLLLYRSLDQNYQAELLENSTNE